MSGIRGRDQYMHFLLFHSAQFKSWVFLVIYLLAGASLEAQLVKNPPTMRETWVQPLGWEDPLEKGKATLSSILAWRILWIVCIVHGVAKSWTRLSDFHFLFTFTFCWLMAEGPNS